MDAAGIGYEKVVVDRLQHRAWHQVGPGVTRTCQVSFTSTAFSFVNAPFRIVAAFYVVARVEE